MGGRPAAMPACTLSVAEGALYWKHQLVSVECTIYVFEDLRFGHRSLQRRVRVDIEGVVPQRLGETRGA